MGNILITFTDNLGPLNIFFSVLFILASIVLLLFKITDREIPLISKGNFFRILAGILVLLFLVILSTCFMTKPNGEPNGKPNGKPTEMKPETRERTFEFSEGNDHCQSPHDLNIGVKADTGWEIDVTSIVPSVSSSKKSTFSGIRDKTKDGFTIKGRIKNRGKCVKVFGKIVTKDGRGSLRGTVRYTEIKIQE